MKKFVLVTVTLVALAAPASAEPAGNVYHYACKSGEDRYALTVHDNRGIVKMQEQGPPFTFTTFRILRSVMPGCGKGGWTLSDGAVFCYYTHGAGSLDWHGKDYECDQADTE